MLQAKLDTRSAVAYCIQGTAQWRKTKGAVAWLEDQLATLVPLPGRLAKNLTPGYAEKVKADKFRKKMDLWVEGKMKQWDDEEAFRTENKGECQTVPDRARLCWTVPTKAIPVLVRASRSDSRCRASLIC